jgi:DNA-binding transcriptional LysR family regulator
MDRFDELIVFTAILDSGSLAAAARRLRRSSPAVTRSLAALERRVGLRLVQRTTRKLAPTEAGRRLASRARQLLADYGEATGTTKESHDAPLQGLLRVTAPSLFGRWHVTPLVASFLAAHPGIRIELMLTNSNLHLIEEGFDVAIRLGPLSDSGLVARRVGQVREVLLASANYLARRGRPRTPRDLMKHDIVFNSPRPAPLVWRFRASGRDRAVSLTPRLIVSDTESMILAIRAGLGIGRALSYQAADDLSSGTLVRLLREFEPPARPIHLVVPTAQYIPPTVRAFLDHAIRVLGAVRAIHE